jgi:hypothetical protein
MGLPMIKMGDTRNEYRILVRHFTGKIYLTERTNVRIELYWIFGDRLLGIGRGWNWNQYRVQWRTSGSVVLKPAGSVTTPLVHEQYTCVYDCNFICR